jgi:hypothetical protein
MNLVSLNLKDIVGPFPANDRCVVILESKEKTIGVPLSVNAAVNLKNNIRGEATPYSYTANIMTAVNVAVIRSSLFISGSEYYSLIHMKNADNKTMKVSSDNPSDAINTSISNSISLTMTQADIDQSLDCTEQYNNIRGICSFPMLTINRTEDLQCACEFVDRVFSPLKKSDK